jgi:hypothetical protein
MQTDLASCVENPKDFHLDVERCMRLDFTGRPMSEYDVADNTISCVGYWMEDTKSFLITYDPLDPVGCFAIIFLFAINSWRSSFLTKLFINVR